MKTISLKKVAVITFGIDFLGIAIAISRAILLDRSPMRYFGENGYLTWISVLQLLIIAIFCWNISNLRKSKIRESTFHLKNKPFVFWRIAAGGMAFFALDEGLEIHENLDKLLHQLVKKQSTAISGRLDDFIVLFYAIAGLLTIYLFKNELKKFAAASKWFVWGVSLSLLTIFLDMLGHDRDTFTPFADNLQQLNDIHHWFSAIEEMPKILAGGVFLIAIYRCFQIAISLRLNQKK